MITIDVVGTGLTVLDRIYGNDSQATVEELGGTCGNVLISLAMLDRRVAPVLSLGDDEVGLRLIRAFENAGAQTQYIRRKSGRHSPIIGQYFDTVSGRHHFAFRCLRTNEELPRYTSIQRDDLEQARHAIENCEIFFCDRLSDVTLTAMEAAAGAGATVYLEPAKIDDPQLFARALAVTSVLKYSNEMLEGLADEIVLPAKTIVIITDGSQGLCVRQGASARWSSAFSAPLVRDTCGAGDMVSVGVIDWLIKRRRERFRSVNLEHIMDGVVAGQRLAAANCAYLGARGLFIKHGAKLARDVLHGKAML